MQVNRLLYRAKQRGFLEMDLLVGMWADKNVPKMDAAQLKAMEEVLDQENPDLFKWLTGQESASEAMQANAAFKVLRCTSCCSMQEALRASQGLCRTGFVPKIFMVHPDSSCRCLTQGASDMGKLVRTAQSCEKVKTGSHAGNEGACGGAAE